VESHIKKSVFNGFQFADLPEPLHHPVRQCFASWLDADNAGIGEITMILNELVSQPVKDEVEFLF
jgi:hypothetical protein